MKLKSSVYANVLNPIFTSKELAGSGGMFVEIVILIYIFCGFGVICDKFLIPAIEKIKEKYNISERLAGSTILALGSSISEIASNMNSVLLNKPEEFELGLSGIVGGAVFELSVGLAIGCFLIKKKYIINYPNLKRDLIIYIFIIILLALFIRSKNIDMFKSLTLIVLWIFYMIYLIISSSWDEKDASSKEEIDYFALPNYDQNDEKTQLDVFAMRSILSSEKTDDKSSESKKDEIIQFKRIVYITKNEKIKNIINTIEASQSIHKLFVKFFFKMTSKPWEILLNFLIPTKSNSDAVVFLQFFIPVFLIWNISEIEIYLLEKLMGKMKVPASFLGFTIMSWGNNAPDMFNVASAMAKGMVDLALNAAVASEIHNILIGLGLPWLVYNCTNNKSLVFNSNPFLFVAIMFFSVFIVFFIVAFKYNQMKLDTRFALFLMGCYLVFLIMLFAYTFK